MFVAHCGGEAREKPKLERAALQGPPHMAKRNLWSRSLNKGFSSTARRVLLGFFVLALMTGASCARKQVAAAGATSGAKTTERSTAATAAVTPVTTSGGF